MPRLPARPGLDVVGIHGLELDCIVGIRPHERLREQRVRIELGLGVDTRHAAREARIGLTVDYGQVSEQLMQMLQFRRYHLIEAAAEELSAMLLATHPVLRELTLRIEKPGALEGRAQAASVEVFRRREDFNCLSLEEQKDLAGECSVLQTRDARLSLTALVPGQQLPVSGAQQKALGWLLSGCARCSARSSVRSDHDGSTPKAPASGSRVELASSSSTGSEAQRSELLSAGQFLSVSKRDNCVLFNDGPEPATLFLCSLTKAALAAEELA